jgi:type II secretory pathway component GspD/PulD (secretin)
MSLRNHHVVVLASVLAACHFGFGQITDSTAEPKAAKADQAPAEKPPSARQQSEAEKAYLAGAKALDREDFATAEKDFDTAAELVPHNEQYLAAREIARQHHVTALVQAADKARLKGNADESSRDLSQAFAIDPKNPMVQQHMEEIVQDATPDPPSENQEDTISAGAPIELAPTPGLHSFHLRTNATDLLRQVLTAYGITPTIDSSVKSQPVRIDVDNVDFREAARMSKLLTKTFFVPLDPDRVLVAEDTRENRTKYERLVAETVYFPGLTPTEIGEMGNVARNIFDAQQATVSPSKSTLTLRAPVAKLAVLNSTLAEMLDGRSELQLDVRLYNIAKTRSLNVGVQLPNQATIFNVPTELNSVISGNQALVQQIISSGLASAGDFSAIAAILIASGAVSGSILGQPFAVFGGGETLTGLTTNGATLNLALNSSDTRILDSLTLRVLDQEESTIRAGTRYPIITSSYSNLAGSSLAIPGLSSAGVSSALAGLGIGSSSFNNTGQVIPQVQYEDLGLTLKVKPYIQKDRDVSINVDLELVSLAGSSINNIPVLDNQQYKAITTLKQGETALVVSTITKQQTKAVTGVPGLTDLPGFQNTTNNQTENDVSELLILITPRIVREAHTQEAGHMFVLPVHP